MAEALDPVLTQPHISNRILRSLLLYFRESQGPEFVRDIVQEAGLSLDYVQDTERWVSNTFTERLILAVGRRLHPPLEEVPGKDHPVWQHWHTGGRLNMRRDVIGPVWLVLRALGSPRRLYEEVPRLIARGNRTTLAELVESTSRSVTLRVAPKEGCPPEHAGSCWARRGIFEAIPTIWGMPPGEVVEKSCMHDLVHPAEACLYEVRFRSRGLRDLVPLLLATLMLGLLGFALGMYAGTGPLAVPLAALGAVGGLSAIGWRRFALARAAHEEDAERLGALLARSDERYSTLWEEGQELKKALLANRKFSGYLANDLVERILEDPSVEQTLGGERTDAAVLFADIVGFTPRCEASDAETIVAELNLYFDHIDRVIAGYDGIIDKRIGDGIMVVFVSRDGEGVVDQRMRAMRCGLGMLDAVRDVNHMLDLRGSKPIQIRVGLAAGLLVQGNMGSPIRLEYTVIGDVVNKAARLEGQAKPGHLVAEKDFKVLVMSAGQVVDERQVQVKGKTEVLEIIEVAPRERD